MAWVLSLSEKLRLYKHYKTSLFSETYLNDITSKTLMKTLYRFRCGSHKLAIETGRWLNIDRSERLCEYCLEHCKISYCRR